MRDAPIAPSESHPTEMGTGSVAQTPSDTTRTPSGDGDGSLLRTRYQPLIVVLAAASLGIIADRRLGLPVACWWTAAAVAWTAWFALWWASRAPRGRQSHFRGENATSPTQRPPHRENRDIFL